MGVGLIWMCLLRLPLQLWVEEIFKCIGDDLGVYLDHESSFQETECLEITRILMHLDTQKGLVESY